VLPRNFAHLSSPPIGKIGFKVSLCDTFAVDEKSICSENFSAKAAKMVKER
jgi:hypothetical protein